MKSLMSRIDGTIERKLKAYDGNATSAIILLTEEERNWFIDVDNKYDQDCYNWEIECSNNDPNMYELFIRYTTD